MGFKRNLFLLNASSEICSGIFVTRESFKSPVFNHGIGPTKFLASDRFGVVPDFHSPIKPKFVIHQLFGIGQIIMFL